MATIVGTEGLAGELGSPKPRKQAVRRRRGRPFAATPLGRWVVPTVTLIVFFGLWEIVGRSVNPIILSTPQSVVGAFASLINSGQLGSAFVFAMEDFWLGFVLAVVSGLVIGTLMGRSVTAERAISPFVSFFQAMPSIAAVPLVIVWLGTGYEARVSTVWFLAILPVIIFTYTGVRNTPRNLIEMSRIYGMSPWGIVRHVAFPYALPTVFGGIRRAMGLGLIGMMIAEMEISVTGLGAIVIDYGDNLQTNYLLAGICTAAMVGVITVGVLEVVRRKVFPWIEATSKAGAEA